VVRRVTERLIVTKVAHSCRPHEAKRAPDELVVEEPMSIQLDGTTVATTMRTPGHDYELAAGFCFTERLLAGSPILSVRYCADGPAIDSEFNIVTVDTGGRAPSATPRLGNVHSSCGWCGNDHLEEMCATHSPLPLSDPIAVDVLADIPRTVRSMQPLFEATGSVHASAVFDSEGTVLVVREDVGRHNAVDKVVGSILLGSQSELPATGRGLFVSGRASIEMVQKAWSAGFSTLLAASAPTALAVAAARRANLVLVGFMRDDSFNIYSPERPSRETMRAAES